VTVAVRTIGVAIEALPETVMGDVTAVEIVQRYALALVPVRTQVAARAKSTETCAASAKIATKHSGDILVCCCL